MKRRQLTDEPPESIIVFDGDAYPEPAEWREAYARFQQARTRWAKEHRIAESDLPDAQIGDEPWDITLI